MILIAYDGSDDAKAAVEAASGLFPGEPTTVLTVWQRFVDTMARVGAGVAMVVDYDEIDESAGATAAERSAEGAQLASEAGLEATARTAVVITSAADAIITEAATIDAKAIVMGSRGLTGVKSMLLGSTSHAVLQHSDRPVMVVPSPAVAARRAEALAHQ